MPDFSYWLRPKENPDPETAALQAFAGPRSDWPWWTDRLGDYVAVINAANPTNRDALIISIAENYGRWRAERVQSGPGWVARHLGTIFLGLFGLIVAVAIFYGLFFNQEFFKMMADTSHARGLITFLFAFATIAIILLVAITTFWMPKEDVEVRSRKPRISSHDHHRSSRYHPRVLLRVARHLRSTGRIAPQSGTSSPGDRPCWQLVEVDDLVGRFHGSNRMPTDTGADEEPMMAANRIGFMESVV
jgi:hypothetical protein